MEKSCIGGILVPELFRFWQAAPVVKSRVSIAMR